MKRDELREAMKVNLNKWKIIYLFLYDISKNFIMHKKNNKQNQQTNEHTFFQSHYLRNQAQHNQVPR